MISSVVVAIPVKNEEATIGVCLNTLALQTRPFDRLVLLLNNCTDATLEICRGFATQRAGVEIVEQKLSGDLASAGEARRRALNHASRIAPDSIILTTDADAVPELTWIERNIRKMQQGADVVCGSVEINPQDAANFPPALHDDDASENNLLAILDELNWLLNPDPFDPWPRHQQQSGASIALRCDVLILAGGPPAVAVCEDRALVEKLRLVDARIRHAPDIVVQVSDRFEGRAAGGMAETLKRRIIRQDFLTDEKLEPAVDALRRAVAQARLRAVRQGSEDEAEFARDLLIAPSKMLPILQETFHGKAWADTQALSPVLRRRRVAFAGLIRETRIAVALRNKLLLDATLAQTHMLTASMPYA